MFDKYPNTDFSQINLDWLLAKIHELEEKQKQASPTKLPNPFPLEFTGATSGSYDGSAPVTVNIPQGGEGGAVTSVNRKTGDVILTANDIMVNQQASVANILAANGSTISTHTQSIESLNENKADKAEIPTSLPNPSALTFTGASTGSYDGSAPLTINIPAGGTGGDNWELINSVTLDANATEVRITRDSNGLPFDLEKFYLEFRAVPNTSVITGNTNAYLTGFSLASHEWYNSSLTRLITLTSSVRTTANITRVFVEKQMFISGENVLGTQKKVLKYCCYPNQANPYPNLLENANITDAFTSAGVECAKADGLGVGTVVNLFGVRKT